MNADVSVLDQQKTMNEARNASGDANYENEGEARLISVVIPCYQEERFITGCLASVRSFTLPTGWDMEILVVDGGSRDATRQLVQDFARQDGRVRLLENPRRAQSSGLNI